MKSVVEGQRVIVKGVGMHGAITALMTPAIGTVTRKTMRGGGDVWVKLDVRMSGGQEALHSFPADDATRSTAVITNVTELERAPS